MFLSSEKMSRREGHQLRPRDPLPSSPPPASAGPGEERQEQHAGAVSEASPLSASLSWSLALCVTEFLVVLCLPLSPHVSWLGPLWPPDTSPDYAGSPSLHGSLLGDAQGLPPTAERLRSLV